MGKKEGLLLIFLLLFCKKEVQKEIYPPLRWIKYKETYIQVPNNWEPSPPQVKVFSQSQWDLYFYSRSFSRGETFYVEIRSPLSESLAISPVEHKLFYINLSQEIPLTPTQRDWKGIYVFPPTLQKSKQEFLWVILYEEEDIVEKKKFSLFLHLRSFPVSKRKLVFSYRKKRKVSPQERKEFHQRLQEQREKKKRAFSLWEDIYFLTNRLSYPLPTHYITSEWYKKRKKIFIEIYRGRRRRVNTRISIHRGVDLGAKAGTPVLAMGRGRVILSDRFHYEGNFILISHGKGIFSGYMHLQERKVQEGDIVKAGDIIGKVGSTGLATGPHLHFALWIGGIPADPLSIYSLPIR